MSEISKFVSMDQCSGNVKGGEEQADWKNTTASNASFKVCKSNNLPANTTSAWAKLKELLTYEIKVELTPYQQKIEDEINEFLHQDVTWQSFKNFLFQDVVITTGKTQAK